MKAGFARFWLVIFVYGLLAGTLLAQHSPNSPKKPWYKAINFNGLVSASYSFNFDRPANGLNAFRVFDFRDNRPRLDVAELVIQKPVARVNDWGFRADFAAGQSIPKIAASNGLFRNEETGEARDFDFHQLFVSYIAPAGKGLRLDVGKYITHMGYEVIEGYDGWNDNATRSFLFGYAIPFTQTGIRVTYPFSGKFSAQFHIFNGWDDFDDNNSAKSVGLQLAFTPTPGLSFNINALYGPEQRNNNQDARQVWELTGTWKATDQVSFGINYLYGHERHALGPELNGNWTGFAGYMRAGLTTRWALCLRGEFFDDRDGARTGIAQKLKEVTVSPEFKWTKHVILRGDLRCDFSDMDVFPTRALSSGHQGTALVNLLFMY
jgi:hypothetical protein